MPKALRTAFIENYYRFATPDDLPATQAARETLAQSHLEWGNRRKAGEILVRAFNPSAVTPGFGAVHTVIETVVDDSPFIVDSLAMRLNALSQGVLVTLHSVMHVERDGRGKLRACHALQSDDGDTRGVPESWTHFEIPRVLDADELRQLERQLSATLEDVARAVHDWPHMLRLLRTKVGS